MSKTRLLWVGDAIAETGFARVTHAVLGPLYDTGNYDISILGVNYWGNPHGYPYEIWPARNGGDSLGYQTIGELTNNVKPDIIVLFNDLWVIVEYLAKLLENEYHGKVITYFPVDSSGYREEWVKALYTLDRVLVYTEFAGNVITEAGYKGEYHVVPHGIDTKIFHKEKQEDARKSLVGLEPDDFIIFNGNRNQPRKRIDTTIKAFCQFAKDKEDARLYLHMGLSDLGWDIIPMFHREAKRHKLKDIWRRLILTGANAGYNPVTIETLNTIYNTADVGVNTSLGEGWGLVNFEQSAVGVPQVVSSYAASGELYKDRGLTVDPFYYLTAQKINTEGGLLHEDDVAQAFQTYYDEPKLRRQHGDKMYEYIRSDRFTWKAIGKQWDKHIREVLEK